MSRSLRAEALAALGFPRTRGDEPTIDWPEVERYMFSPHTRG